MGERESDEQRRWRRAAPSPRGGLICEVAMRLRVGDEEAAARSRSRRTGRRPAPSRRCGRASVAVTISRAASGAGTATTRATCTAHSDTRSGVRRSASPETPSACATPAVAVPRLAGERRGGTHPRRAARSAATRANRRVRRSTRKERLRVAAVDDQVVTGSEVVHVDRGDAARGRCPVPRSRSRPARRAPARGSCQNSPVDAPASQHRSASPVRNASPRPRR